MYISNTVVILKITTADKIKTSICFYIENIVFFGTFVRFGMCSIGSPSTHQANIQLQPMWVEGYGANRSNCSGNLC